MERVLRMHNDREAGVGGNNVMDRCSPDFNRWGLSRKVGEKLVFRPACIYQGEEWKRRFCEKKKKEIVIVVFDVIMNSRITHCMRDCKFVDLCVSLFLLFIQLSKEQLVV